MLNRILLLLTVFAFIGIGFSSYALVSDMELISYSPCNNDDELKEAAITALAEKLKISKDKISFVNAAESTPAGMCGGIRRIVNLKTEDGKIYQLKAHRSCGLAPEYQDKAKWGILPSEIEDAEGKPLYTPIDMEAKDNAELKTKSVAYLAKTLGIPADQIKISNAVSTTPHHGMPWAGGSNSVLITFETPAGPRQIEGSITCGILDPQWSFKPVNFEAPIVKPIPATVFDEEYYLRTNPDVAAAVKRGDFKNGRDHYDKHGAKEGRNPNAGFDEKAYLAANPDVDAAVKRGDFKCGWDHYVKHGAKEGRDPNPSLLPILPEPPIPDFPIFADFWDFLWNLLLKYIFQMEVVIQDSPGWKIFDGKVGSDDGTGDADGKTIDEESGSGQTPAAIDGTF